MEQLFMLPSILYSYEGGAGIYACVAVFQDNRLQPLRKCNLSTIAIPMAVHEHALKALSGDLFGLGFNLRRKLFAVSAGQRQPAYLQRIQSHIKSVPPWMDL